MTAPESLVCWRCDAQPGEACLDWWDEERRRPHRARRRAAERIDPGPDASGFWPAVGWILVIICATWLLMALIVYGGAWLITAIT